MSCIFVDPHDGPTDPSRVIHVTQALLEAGCYEVSLGDTLGVGTPADVARLLKTMLRTLPVDRLAGHFHDTYGQAIANVMQAFQMGIRTFDSSIAGLGGCPFAKGAKGNLSTEDLVYSLEGMGIRTGVNLNDLAAIGTWISKQLKLPNGSRAGAALTAKAEATSTSATTPQLPTRTWTTLQTTDEYQASRSGFQPPGSA